MEHFSIVILIFFLLSDFSDVAQGDDYWHSKPPWSSTHDSYAGSFGETVEEFPKHHCDRPCEYPPRPRRCEYRFAVELYRTISKACFDCPRILSDCERPHCIAADGVRRPVIVVNRQFPGPQIRVCHRDRIVVNVVNHVEASGISIHWHGQYQRGTPWADGVSLVTQCPIHYASSWTYEFLADPPGTHWWHSHSGTQRMDGFHGALIVGRAAEMDPNSGLYDFDLADHVIIISDWIHVLASTMRAEDLHDSAINGPRSLLINGRGEFEGSGTPLAVFRVRPGRAYRFRVIQATGNHCPIELSVDGHELVVVATDGVPVEPKTIGTLGMTSAERYDFVLRAERGSANYLIRVRGQSDSCGNVSVVALLNYEGVASDEPPLTTSRAATTTLLNPWNSNTDIVPDTLPVTALSSVEEFDVDESVHRPVYLQRPDFVYHHLLDFHQIDSWHTHSPSLYPISSFQNLSLQFATPQINFITNALPSSPFLYQHDDIDPFKFCNDDTAGYEDCEFRFCECHHKLSFKLNQLVEFVLINLGRIQVANHPMHIHGHHFWVVGWGKIGESTTREEFERLDAEGKIERNLITPPMKDTVSVPNGGYAIIRFYTNNPGWWLFHCHVNFHLGYGMSMVIQVGEEWEVPSAPDKFPRCGSWPIHKESVLAEESRNYYPVVSIEDSPASQFCADKDSGFYSNRLNCTEFYHCSVDYRHARDIGARMRGTALSCGEGQHFSENDLGCVDYWKSECLTWK